MVRSGVEYADEQITVYRYCKYNCKYCYVWTSGLFSYRVKSGKYDPVEEAFKYYRVKTPKRIVVSFTCLPPNSLVMTPNGLKRIDEIKEGEVVCGLNKNTKVIEVYKRYYSGEVVEIKPEYFPPQLFTPEHPILVYEQKERIHSKDDWMNILKSKPKWVPAGSIEINRDSRLNPKRRFFVVFPKYMLAREEKIKIDFRKYAKPNFGFNKAIGRNEKYRDFLLKGELDEDLAWLLGLFIADGSISSTAIVISLSKKEKTTLKKLERIIEKLGLSPCVINRASTYDVFIPSNILMRFIEDIIYCEPRRGLYAGKPRKKKIPSFMFKAKKNIVKSFIEGYFAGDGNVLTHPKGWKYIELISGDLDLLRQIQILMFKLGMHPSLYTSYRNKGFGNSKEIHHLRVKMKKKFKRLIETEKYFIIPIRRVRKIRYKGYVYNLMTESSNYAIPYIVHNCDPYPPEEQSIRLTLKVLLTLCLTNRHKIMILTKNPFPASIDIKDNLPLLLHPKLYLGTTIISLDKTEWEPNAPHPQDRIDAIGYIPHIQFELDEEIDIKTWISIEPIIPDVTNPIEIIEETKLFTDWYVLGALNYYTRFGFNKNQLKTYYNQYVPKAIQLLEELGKPYWIKSELLKWLEPSVLKKLAYAKLQQPPP